MSRDRVAIVVQARTSSQRLPGKVLMPLDGAPAIVRMMERVSRGRHGALRVVATSVEPSDDQLASVVRDAGFAVARGPLDDVLQRLLSAVPEDFDTVVRLTGDCPLVDPSLVDYHIETFWRLESSRDGKRGGSYVTNAVQRTQPDGFDVEVVSRALLAEADRRATSRFDREHVLTWVRERATVVPVVQDVDLSRVRLTLDTREDYDCIAAIYDALHPGDPAFDTTSVYDLLVRRPDLIRIAREESLDERQRAFWREEIERHRRGPIAFRVGRAARAAD